MFTEATKVSVCITTYNQENYIAEALESVVNQKTLFPFEVIVHDDASTDRTPKIIEEFAKRYPSLFITIIQEQNQVSQGVNIDKDFILPRCRGKYLAFLEGDDYWLDQYKLQKQYDAMERQPNSSICVHRVELIDESGRHPNKYLPSKKKINQECLISGTEYLQYQEYLFQTGSYFFKTRYMREFSENGTTLAEHFNGDDCILRWAIQKGTILFLNETMSVYRKNVPNGWSTNYAKHSSEERIDYLKRTIKAELLFNQESHFRYRSVIEGRILSTILIANSYNHQETNRLLQNYQEIVDSFSKRPPKNQFEKQVLFNYKLYQFSPRLHKIMRRLNHFYQKLLAD